MSISDEAKGPYQIASEIAAQAMESLVQELQAEEKKILREHWAIIDQINQLKRDLERSSADLDRARAVAKSARMLLVKMIPAL